jgi:acetylornithine deacetylase
VVRGEVTGLSGHSSQPAYGVNAVHAAAHVITWAAQLAQTHADSGPFAEGFDPPHSTVHVGLVRGGSTVNIIPQEATFAMEWRTIPGDDPLQELAQMRAYIAASIEPAMKRVHPDAGITLTAESWYPELLIDEAHPLVSLVVNATGIPGTGKVSYATEAGIFQEAGIPTIICGPGHIAQAHKPDEWIARSELDACDRFIREVARQYAGSNNPPV